MKKFIASLMAAAVVMISGCAYLPGGTDLGMVANDAGLTNVTTGDGTFENYKAVGHYTGTEIGIAIGIPGLIKLMELYPQQSNEGLLLEAAEDAAADGSNAMINVTPHKETYYGIPFGIIGLYVDKAEGTGISQQ